MENPEILTFFIVHNAKVLITLKTVIKKNKKIVQKKKNATKNKCLTKPIKNPQALPLVECFFFLFCFVLKKLT